MDQVIVVNGEIKIIKPDIAGIRENAQENM